MADKDGDNSDDGNSGNEPKGKGSQINAYEGDYSSAEAQAVIKRLNVVKTKVEMMSGYVKNNPQFLFKFSAEVVSNVAALQEQLDGIDIGEAERTALQTEVSEAHDSAMVYFEASRGLTETESVSTNVNSNDKGDDLFKLKGCKPPTFDGNVRNFQQWKQHFDAAVHSNEKLSDDHRMVHLLSCTRLEARKFLEGYPATGSSYKTAYEALAKRFGDPAKLAQTFYFDLTKLPELYDIDDGDVNLNAERSNLDEIKRIVLNLETCGTFNTEHVQGLVLRKMKRRRCEAAFDKLRETYPLLDFPLTTLVETLEAGIYANEILALRVEGARKETEEPNEDSSENFTTLVSKARAKRDAKAKSLQTARRADPPKLGDRRQQSSSSVTLPCLFCEGKHVSAECRNVMTLSARKTKLEQLGRCSICNATNHQNSKCTNRERPCYTCRKPGHCSILCLKTLRKLEENHGTKRRAETTSEEPRDKRNRNEEGDSRKKKKSGTFLETFVCNIEMQGKRTMVRGVIDGGSNVSYIRCTVLNRLKIRPERSTVIGVQGIGSDNFTPVQSGNVEVKFIGQNEQQRSCTLYTTDKIVGNLGLTPSPDEVSSILPYNTDYADPDIFCNKQRPVDILIGNDVRNLFVKLNRDRKVAPGLVLRCTIFGWIPSGRATSIGECHSLKTCAVSTVKKQYDKSQTETDKVCLLWDLEVLGIRNSEVDETENAIIEQFRKTTRFENSRYVVSWPRRTEVLNLPTHYRMCIARLKSLLNSTEQNVIEQCNDIIADQLKSGVIERAPRQTRYDIHYIPFKPVVQEGKSPRIVYDASAGTKSNQSLNDRLFRGPVLTGDLVGMLLNFRLKEIGVVSDIEKAFLQVGLDVADRDVVRFLWVEDCTRTFEETNIVAYRFTRTPFGVVSSPFLLNMCLQEILTEGDNVWCEFARSRFYVDNFVASVATVEDAVELYESVTVQLAHASFNLRDWTSNSSKFTNVVNIENRMDAEDPIKVLGLNWNRNSDKLSPKFKKENDDSTATLRTALSALQEVFDPMGLFAPCLLDLKLYIQECWKAKLTWDEVLPTPMEVRYRKLLVERETIRELEVPRYLWTSRSNEGVYELHCFCDASKLAYGCAILLVHKTRGKGEARLIYTKQRIAPIQNRSIPQLELLAAVVGKRAVTFAKTKLDIEISKTVLWADATTVIQWLHSPKLQVQFVQNRLNEIRRAPNLMVKYVQSKDNVADVLTRGQKADKLKSNELWWKGPSWLAKERLWPASPADAPDFHTHSASVITLANVANMIESVTLITDKFENRYSTWESYVRRILRLPFVSNFYKFSLLSEADSWARAELILLRLIQRKYFPVEFKSLQENILWQSGDLDLFLHEDGLIRCAGPLRYEKVEGELRLIKETLNWDNVHPIYLPRGSKLVQNLIRSVHRKCLHQGDETTLTSFRERFWITKARAMVKSVIYRCAKCRRWKSGPYQLPPAPPLPHIRMTPVVPFANTGVDHFGPFHVKLVDSEVISKVYGVIFACLVTRAIHLELVSDMSADQFLLSLIRFTSRRGIPQFLLSDNAKNLKYVQPLVGNEIEIHDPRLKTFISEQGISWHFINAYSPWEGGSYERLIGLVKRTIVFAIGSKVVDYITLNTAFSQVENVVNSRPLTHVSAGEIIETLTPNSFLRPAHAGPETRLNVSMKNAVDAVTLLKGYKATRRVIELFISTFHSRYLRFLRERYNRVHPAPKGAVRFAPKVGHVVLVKVSDSSRAKWPLGRIEELDLRKTHAWVRIIDWAASNRMKATSDSQQPYRTKVVKRPVNSLYPLEIEPEERNDPESPPDKQAPSTSA